MYEQLMKPPRQATNDTGTIASLTILCVVNEPTAAPIGGKSQIIVYDLCGGTFNISLLSVDNGVFGVLATAGNTYLGGEGFNTNRCTMSKLKKEFKKANHTHSSQMSTKLEIKLFENGNDFSDTPTHAKFEELNTDLFCKTMKPVNVKEDIVLFDGSTLIPKVQQLIKEYFGENLFKGITPNKAVAYGTAIWGSVLTSKETVEGVVLIDICP
ncbi:actin-like ATPase domain-containing protein [Ceratobasidium sp. AG-I]|nr:actin-like ATPase domain-containing protein [Ceratobasidium sp. AG-I]